MKSLLYVLLSTFVIANLQAQDLKVTPVQHSLITKHAATWCPPCGLQAWTDYETMIEQHEDQALIWTTHISSSSLLYSPTAVDILANFLPGAYQPDFFHNNDYVGDGGSNTRNSMASRVENTAKLEPVAQSAVKVSYIAQQDSFIAEVKTRFFKDASGDFYLGVYYLDREVIAYQASRGNDQLHKRILRKAFTKSSFGEKIASGIVTAGTEIDYRISTNIVPEDIDNKQFAVIIWRKNANKYEFVNAISINGAKEKVVTDLKATKVLDQSFKVWPTTVLSTANIEFSVAGNTKDAALTLVNSQGQIVQSLYRGALAGGLHRFDFTRMNPIPSGIYFIHLRTSDAVVSRKILLP